MPGIRALVLGALIAHCGGCALLAGKDAGPVPLPAAAAVRIQSGRATGSGCLLYSERAAGAYVLTAAHLLEAPERVLCRFAAGGDAFVWRPARVLRTRPRADLALLWVPQAVPGDIVRAAWVGRAPARDADVQVLVAAETGPPQPIAARVTGRGRLVAEQPLVPGMSGAGVFREGRLAGVLFGQARRHGTAVPREGRFIGAERIRDFLETGFGFVIAGVPPAEPR